MFPASPQLPAGLVDCNETVGEAAVRELKEETGEALLLRWSIYSGLVSAHRERSGSSRRGWVRGWYCGSVE